MNGNTEAIQKSTEKAVPAGPLTIPQISHLLVIQHLHHSS